jgi:hypothetical protein
MFAHWRTSVLVGLSVIAALAGYYTVAAILFVGFVAVSAYLTSEQLRTEGTGSNVCFVKTEVVSPAPASAEHEPKEDANPAGEEDETADLDEFAFGSMDTIQLERSEKRYRSCSHTPDCDEIWENVYDYRIEGTKVFHRLLESKTDRYGEIEYEVQDNVVLEHEIRQRHPEEPVLAGCGVEKLLEEMRGSVEWSEIHGRLKYFILSRHPEILPTAECRRYFRREIQRLQLGFDALIKKAAELGMTLLDQELCKFSLPEGMSKDSIPKILSEESLLSCNISLPEFSNGKNVIATLKKLLGDET